MDPPDAIIHFNEDVIKVQSESFKFLQLYIFIVYFYDMLGMKPNFLDIFNPSKKVLYRQISTVIEFLKFQLTQLADFGAVQDANKQYLDKCEEAKKEINDLSTKVTCLKFEKNEKKIYIEAAKKRNAVLKEKINAFIEERKKLAEYNQAAIKEEEAVLAEKEELTNRYNGIQKKMSIYEKLLIKSPERLKRDMDKNDARIQELEKLIKIKTDENVEQKKMLFEREKFVESFKTVGDILDSFYQNDVQKANNIMKEIEKEKEEITNLNFYLKQIMSVMSTLNSDNQKLTEMLEKMKLDLEQQCNNLNEKIIQNEGKTKQLAGKNEEIEKKKVQYLDDIAKFKSKSEKTINEAFEKILQIKKNEELLQLSTNAKMDLIDQLDRECRGKIENGIKAKLERTLDFLNDF